MFIVQIAGNLGRDPETRFTPNGQKVTAFSIAVNQRKGKEDVTMWVRVTVWGDRFDKMIAYLKKGSSIIVIGRMNPPTTYVDKEGKTQVSIEVTAEMLEFSPFGKTDRPADGQQPYANAQSAYQPAGAPQISNTSQTPSYGSQDPYSFSQPTFGSQPGTSHSFDFSDEDDKIPF